MQNTVAPPAASPAEARSVWPRVLPFVALTFGLTWLLDLVVWLRGASTLQTALVMLQLQMLLPAASAILLGLFSTRYGSAKVRESSGNARLFFHSFLALVAIYAAIAAAALTAPGLAPSPTVAGPILSILSVLVLLVLRLARGRESFARAGLTFGRPIHWLGYGLPIAAFYVGMTALNAAFGLGSVPVLGPVLKAAQMPVEALIVVGAIQTVVLGPLLGLVITFGEEYGWRGYLQGELINLGRVRGILALGIIWGLWHAPIVLMGFNYPGYPIVGILMMTLYCIGLGFVLSYAVLKTGSIWLAAFLHALNNQVHTYLALTVYAPRQSLFQFDMGLFMFVPLAIVVLLILRDPIWRVGAQDSASVVATGDDHGSAGR